MTSIRDHSIHLVSLCHGKRMYTQVYFQMVSGIYFILCVTFLHLSFHRLSYPERLTVVVSAYIFSVLVPGGNRTHNPGHALPTEPHGTTSHDSSQIPRGRSVTATRLLQALMLRMVISSLTNLLTAWYSALRFPLGGASEHGSQEKGITISLSYSGQGHNGHKRHRFFFKGHTRGIPPGNSRTDENIIKCLSNCE